MSRYLVTTADERSWPADRPVLFLGEWCLLHSRKERWSKIDAEVLPYHWDDRAKLHSDYKYLKGVHERLLKDLTGKLNQIHGVDRSLRYWRILIGPWLGYFTQVLFDRWESIQQAVGQHELSGTTILAGEEESLVPNDTQDLGRFHVGDEWNHHLYSVILQQFTKVPCARSVREAAERMSGAAPAAVAGKRRIRRMLAAWYARSASLLTGDRDAFFLSTYLPFRDEMRMHQRLGQFPQLWRHVSPVRVAADLSQRQWVVAGESRSEFESCARSFIPQQMPTIYLEGYGQLVEQAARLPWPGKPKLIWTSNAYHEDDVFKAWAAQKVEQGSPLVAGQHGGHYGMGRWSFVEDHEIAISDRYLSWGWTETGQSNVTPIGVLKSRPPLGVRHAEQPGALLVACAVPRYTYYMYSVAVSRQWLDYFDDQCTFVGHLPQAIRAALTVRLYAHDYGWGQARRWRERFPDLRLDDGRSSIYDLVRQTRLYIATYNATTYLESFVMDVPTVIYWNPNHWELRDSAIPYFDELKRVGIFHETPDSAARQVALVWNDVDGWWSSPAVRDTVARFKARYCQTPPDLLERIEQVLREVMTIPGKSATP